MISLEVPAEHVGAVLAGLAPGFLIQHALLGDVDAAIFSQGVHALVTDKDLGARQSRPQAASRQSKTDRWRPGP